MRIKVLGPIELVVSKDESRHLAPTAACLLARLAAVAGKAVTRDVLYADVWRTPTPGGRPQSDGSWVDPVAVNRAVHKGIHSLRGLMGEDSIETGELVVGRTSMATYRLVPDVVSLDCAEFTQLVNKGLREQTATRVAYLENALDLWRAEPFPEVAHVEPVKAAIARLCDLRDRASAELIKRYIESGQEDKAHKRMETWRAQSPDAKDADSLARLLRDADPLRRPDVLAHRAFPALGTAVTVLRGDLFAQDDADIVVGVSDTFDTTTRNDVIHPDSVQGQLITVLFDGDSSLVDKAIDRSLQRVGTVGVESREAKPHGRRKRYPLGTVVKVEHQGRDIYLLAYSRMLGNSEAKSTEAELTASLTSLWRHVYRRGARRPVAMAVAGAGRARIDRSTHNGMIILAVEAFLAVCRELSGPTRELRIMVRPEDAAEVEARSIENYFQTLDDLGRRRAELA